MINTKNNAEQLVNNIYEFVKDYFYNINDKDIKNAIWMHLFYGTIDVIYSGDKIIACVRWNISETGMICHVLDLIISPESDGVKIVRKFILRNYERFPSVKWIKFERKTKYPSRSSRLYRISGLLNIKGR